MPVGLALAIRQFLGRVNQITAQSRAVMGVRLAEQAATLVAPPPPPGTHPEDFLAALVATRRDRDAARLQREANLRHRLAGQTRP
jgi:hypothetical protein